MVMIGEGSNVKDRPIYLQVSDILDLSNCFWYVIEEEEKDDDDDDRIEEEEIHHKKKKKNKNNNNLKQTDKITELVLPSINFFNAKLVVFNSRIYLFGGYPYSKDGEYPKDSGYWLGHSREVVHVGIKEADSGNGWLKATFEIPRRTLSVAVFQNSGLFVALGMTADNVEPLAEFFDAEFLDDSPNGIWWPAPPAPVQRFLMENPRLLAVTDTKVYAQTLSYECCMGMCFDVLNSEWKVFDLSFHGTWAPGVVLDFCSNSYLFLFGVRDPDCLEELLSLVSSEQLCTEQLWVYDLKDFKWLPLPVQGFKEDDTFFPDPNDPPSFIHLLQVNDGNKNKLALVWSTSLINTETKPIETITEIRCTKFIIHCTPDKDSQHPIFRATVVSSGSYQVKGSSGSMLNCAPSLIGEDKVESILPKEWKEN